MHDPARLTRRTLSAVENAEATDGIRVSAISAWEVAMKHALGKLELTLDIDVWFQQASTYPNLVVEPVSAHDAIASTRLPSPFHRDPADRIIVAMARRYGVQVITSDKLIRAYPHVATIW